MGIPGLRNPWYRYPGRSLRGSLWEEGATSTDALPIETQECAGFLAKHTEIDTHMGPKEFCCFGKGEEGGSFTASRAAEPPKHGEAFRGHPVGKTPFIPSFINPFIQNLFY